MELEHVEGGNGNDDISDAKRGDGTPSQDTPQSPYSSGTEFDISEQGSLHKSSTRSQYDRDLSPYPPPIPSLAPSQIPQTSSPPEASELQNSPPEPSTVFTEPSPVISPPIQAAEHPPGYDSNRIPTSIFSSKHANTSDWSATSNESVFSIQMGNNSFSRDCAILFGKSGEFSNPEDWNGSQSNLFGVSGDFSRLEDRSSTAQSNPQSASEARSDDLSNLPSVREVPSHEESTVLSGEHPRTGDNDDSKSPVVASQALMEDHTEEKPIPAQAVNSPVASPKSLDVENPPAAVTTPPTPSSPATFQSPSRISNGSGNSNHSFAFPVLVNDNAKESSASLKVVQEKPEVPQPEEIPQPQPPQDPKETPKVAPQTRRCWCFPCLPRFC